MKTGAGGQVTGVTIVGTTRLCRTDVGGVWKQNPSTRAWKQLINIVGVPSSALSFSKPMSGGYEVLIAPSDSTRVYIVGAPDNGGENTPYCLVSNDAGETFTDPGTFGAVAGVLSSNIFAYKFHGPKGGVDPNNKDVVYFGTPHNGAVVSSDGGLTWATIPNVPASTNGNPEIGFCFDTTSATTSSGTLAGHAGITRTSKLYVCSQGNGVYQSTDGGVSFSTMAGSPSVVRHARISSTGVLYVADGTNLQRFKAATWATKTPPVDGNGLESVTMTSVATSIICCEPTGQLFWSANEGDTWTGLQSPSVYDASATIPWLSYLTGSGGYMSVGEIIEDPTSLGALILGHGLGVAKTTSGTGSSSTSWLDDSVGIEELVTNGIISPPGQVPLACFWDRPVFRYPNTSVYPTFYGPNGPSFPDAIEFGWSVAYSVSSPATAHLLCQTLHGAEVSSYSNDNGLTWTAYSNFPVLANNGYAGGSLASTTPDHVVIAVSQNGPLLLSLNARSVSATWSTILKASFSNGITAAMTITDPQTLPVTGVGAGAANGSGGNKVRFTLSGGVGTFTTGAYAQFQTFGATGDVNAVAFGTFVLTVIDSTHIDLDGTSYVTGALGTGSVLNGAPGWGAFARYVNKRGLRAYQATADKYMAINSNPTLQGGGTHVSTDAGQTWTRKSTFNDSQTASNQLEAVLGKDHFFHGHGQTGGSLFYNRDDGVTWSTVTCAQGTISDVLAVSTGKIKPGNDYPSVYFVGTIAGDYGVWQSDNSDANWAAMTGIVFTKHALPADFYGNVNTICGDSNTYGRFFVGASVNALIEFNS